MNFSASGSGRNLRTASTPTPISMGYSLLTDLRDSGASLENFTTMLSYITTASAILCSRINNDVYRDPNFDQIQQTMRYITDMTKAAGGTPFQRIRYIASIHDAARAINADIAAETERYHANMTILLSRALKKMSTEIHETGSFHHTVRRLGRDGLDSAHAVKDLVGHLPTAEFHGGYLGEIARYWRKWAGTGGARPYEDIWTYVAGRVLVQE